MSFKLGFKVNPILRRHGWAPGAGSDWDTAATVKELRFWREQGYEALELLPDHYTASGRGRIFEFTDAEWIETRRVVEDAGMHLYGVLGWRRMIFREPWIAEKGDDLYRVADIGEILGARVIDVLPAYPLPLASPAGGTARPLFRSLWDATTSDFEKAAEWLKAYARRVAQFGAEVSLEMHPDTLTDVPISTLRLKEMIDEPNVGINPDTFDNQWIYPEYPGDLIPSATEQCRLLAPHVNYWHCKNWVRSMGEGGLYKFARVHLDEGDQPISLMVQNLVDVGYEGVAVIETGRGFEYSVSPATLVRSKDYLTFLRDVYAPAVPTRKRYAPWMLEGQTPGGRSTISTPGS